jgi:macrodomain Ter protein organizer (MatP/YcbG family)
MTKDPWTERDLQPGDFDALLATIDPRFVETHAGNPDATLRILVSVEGEDAERLERIAEDRGKTLSEVVAQLLRDADRSAA